jgi:hypothetical protein
VLKLGRFLGGAGSLAHQSSRRAGKRAVRPLSANFQSYGSCSVVFQCSTEFGAHVLSALSRIEIFAIRVFPELARSFPSIARDLAYAGL